MLKAKYFILLICFSFLLKTEAKVTLTSIWGDNMVLQQQSEVTFSGTATSGKRVQATASWNNKKIQTNVDAKGEWKLSLQTPVAGGPYSITFSDGEDLTLQNILIGEVWFCSGQSNMEMPVKGFRGQPVFGSQPYIVSANPKRPLRLYTVKNAWSTIPQEAGVDGEWKEASPEDVADFSATAYFFGNQLLRFPLTRPHTFGAVFQFARVERARLLVGPFRLHAVILHFVSSVSMFRPRRASIFSRTSLSTTRPGVFCPLISIRRSRL